jgi:transcription initiation factor TFIID TATA-box-binding protein
MESSPGFSIPSIGTPLYQPEEDQQFLMSNSPVPTTQQQQNAFVPPHQQISTGSQNVYSLQGFTPQHMLQPPSTSVINFALRVEHLTYLTIAQVLQQALMSPAPNRRSSAVNAGSPSHKEPRKVECSVPEQSLRRHPTHQRLLVPELFLRYSKAKPFHE